MDSISFVAAFGAGFLSFVSPCVLPLLPTFALLLVRPDKDGHAAGRFKSVGAFLAGFTLVFVLMGASASLAGEFLWEYGDWFRKGGAVLLIVMGLFLAGVIPSRFLSREYRPFLQKQTGGGLWGAFLLGAAFTFGWTPCTGPILAGILLFASRADTVGLGALLLFVYALGFSIPFFLLTAVWQKALPKLRKYYNWLPRIHALSGWLMVALGVLLWTDQLKVLIGLLV